MKSKLITLAGVVLITGGLLIGTLVAGWGPLLGLDLQGGVSVVLEPTEGGVDSETLDQAISIIRNRVDGIGVAEPEITRQGDRVVVALPGTDDQERALQLVGTTAEVRFRPVCSQTFDPGAFPVGDDAEPIEGSTSDDSTDSDDGTDDAGPSDEGTDDEADDSTDEADAADAGTDDGADDSTDGADAADAGTDDEADPVDESTGDTETGQGPGGEGEFAYGYQNNNIVDEDFADLDDAGVADLDLQEIEDQFDDEEITTLTPEQIADIQAQAGLGSGCEGAPVAEDGALAPATTEPDDDEFDEFVVLPDADPDNPSLYILGPARTNGEVIRSAESDVADITSSQYLVNITIGGEQRAALDALANECFTRTGDCPSGQMAVTLDGEVVTAPNVNIAEFSNGVQITGNFDQSGAEELALVLRYGSLPVELEAVNQQTVSATIGEDALRAGLIAGVVGLALVAVYMMVMYRVLGAIAMASLVISSALLWIIVAYLGENQGLALTLAGVTGIIVSFGVSLDSNVVVFENLRESVRNGKSVRSTVDRSFANAYSTIVKADFASLIGAVLLYILTIGSVRGFALFLGIATMLDLVVTYFFLRPAISSLGHSKLATENPAAIGMPEPGSGDLGVAS